MGLIGWFKGLDLIGKLGIGLVVLMLFGIAVMTIRHFIDTAFEAAEDKGAAQVRERAKDATITNMEKANEATDAFRSDPAVRDAGCLQDARNPADC